MNLRRLTWRHPTLKINPIKLYMHELLSGSCNIWVTVWSQHTFNDLSTLIGTYQTITVRLQDKNKQLTGICQRIYQASNIMTYPTYKIMLIGPFDLLMHHHDYRIYQNHTALTCLIKTVSRHAIKVDANQTTPSPPKTYIQFNESSATFFKRLCQDLDYVFWHDHHFKIIMMDRKKLTQAPIKQYHIDNLARCNHHIWQINHDGAYSNDPHIQLGDRITKSHYVTGIRLEIRDDATSHQYQQYIQLSNTLKQPIINTPQEHGIDIAYLASDQLLQHPWDQNNTRRPLPKKYRSSLALSYNIKLNTGQPVMIQYPDGNLKNPIIHGYLYDKKNKAPYLNDKTTFTQGLCTSSADEITYNSHHILKIQSINGVRFSAKDINIKSKVLNISLSQHMMIKSQQIRFSSHTRITLKTDHATIIITPDRISINAEKIHLTDPGIGNSNDD